jgi:hypothetical protein
MIHRPYSREHLNGHLSSNVKGYNKKNERLCNFYVSIKMSSRYDMLKEVKNAIEKYHGAEVDKIELEAEDKIMEGRDHDWHSTVYDCTPWNMYFETEYEIPGELCLAYFFNDEVILLREIFTRFPMWHPDNVFNPDLIMWGDEKKKRYIRMIYHQKMRETDTIYNYTHPSGFDYDIETLWCSFSFKDKKNHKYLSLPEDDDINDEERKWIPNI